MAVSPAQLQAMISSMSDPGNNSNSFQGVLYGPSGAGKTVEAVKIMKRILKPGQGVLHVDVGEGSVSIKNHPELRDIVKTIPFTSIEELSTWYDAIASGQMPFLGGIIFDEGSSMAEIDVDRMHAARENGERGDRKGTGSLTPEWPDYNATLARFRAIIADFISIPEFHLIFVAHESETKSKTTGQVTSVHMNLSPKIRENVKRSMHLVARLTTKTQASTSNAGQVEFIREAQVQPIGLYDAKTRINSYGQVKFGTEFLADWIGDWLESGGEQVETEAPVAESDPVPAGMTNAEALEVAAETEPAAADEDEFEPIVID